MSYTKKETQRARQNVTVGTKLVTQVLDATNPVEILHFGGAIARVTFQATDSLAGTVEFSVNGTNWFGSTAIPGANAPQTYTTNNFNSMRVTRTGGTGKLAIAATV